MKNQRITGLHISAQLMRMTVKPEVTIELSYEALSDLQLKRMNKMVESGFIVGVSATALLARSIRLKAKLPVLHLTTYDWATWHNLPPTDEAYDTLKRYVAASKVLLSSQQISAEEKGYVFSTLRRKADEDRIKLLEDIVEHKTKNSNDTPTRGFFLIRSLAPIINATNFGAPPELCQYMHKVRSRIITSETIRLSNY